MTTIRPEVLDELLADYQGMEDLLGEDGLFKQLKKALLERAPDPDHGLNRAELADLIRRQCSSPSQLRRWLRPILTIRGSREALRSRASAMSSTPTSPFRCLREWPLRTLPEPRPAGSF